jgi:uncharacterized membrane protein YgdD (TMEM256/DUF423 family)
MNKSIYISGLVMGLISIILGAFGAHALKSILSVQELITFETGVKYQIYHALFLLFLGNSLLSEKVKSKVFYLIVTGVLFFSGSIYIIALKSLLGIEIGKLGIITPIGGALLILGWLLAMVNVISKK